jgi:hypothetical protein
MINLVKTEIVPTTLQSLLNRLGEFAKSKDKKYYTINVEITSINKISIRAYVEGFGCYDGKTIEECIELMEVSNDIKSNHVDSYKEVTF